MFAAGTAAAILPSGVIMPVRPRVWTYRGWGIDDSMPSAPIDFGMWQDAAMTIPAVNPGHPVMVATRICMFNGVYIPQTADDPTTAPTLCFAPDGTPGLAFDGRGQSMTTSPGVLPIKSPPRESAPSSLYFGSRSSPPDPFRANLYSLAITRPT